MNLFKTWLGNWITMSICKVELIHSTLDVNCEFGKCNHHTCRAHACETAFIYRVRTAEVCSAHPYAWYMDFNYTATWHCFTVWHVTLIDRISIPVAVRITDACSSYFLHLPPCGVVCVGNFVHLDGCPSKWVKRISYCIASKSIE